MNVAQPSLPYVNRKKIRELVPRVRLYWFKHCRSTVTVVPLITVTVVNASGDKYGNTKKKKKTVHSSTNVWKSHIIPNSERGGTRAINAMRANGKP